MDIMIGLSILLIAGFFQGSFIVPGTFSVNWKWENSWLGFSLAGMLLINLLLAFLFIPNLAEVYSSVPKGDLLLLIISGLCWGLGAVLFGISMEKLGMALGYPVIMGIIASFGAIIPLVIFYRDEILTPKGLMLMGGALIVVYGIAVCAKAHGLKAGVSASNNNSKSSSAILLAIAAGILSCLPNIGFSFGGSLVTSALKQGASEFMAANAVWALFFSMGFIPNAVYTVYLLIKNKSFRLFRQSTFKNSILALAMALMWIGSFYLYGISTLRLGAWGSIIGWPLFISISILTGNAWGLARSEWKNAPANAKVKLRQGMAIIFLAIVIIGICNLL